MKLAKDMTNEEFEKYYREVLTKLKEIIPDDLVWVIGLWAKDGDGLGGMDGNIQKELFIVLMEKVRQDLLLDQVKALSKTILNK